MINVGAKAFWIYYILSVKIVIIYLQRRKYWLYPGFSVVLAVACST